MKWVNTFGFFEIVMLSLFLILYVSFFLRVIFTNKKLGLPFGKVFIKAILRFVYVGLIFIALLGPSYGDATQEIKTIGKDIFVCIDLSQSMNANDVVPSRLSKVKFELKNIIEAFNSDRIGLIMFSSEAYLQCPLTYDNNALSLFIQTLNSDMVPNYGTDFGPPLEMALNKFTEKDTVESRYKSRIVILISDGEDFGDDTDDIIDSFEDENISLFTLGVGTTKGSKIPTRNGYKKDRNGKEVVSKINVTSLVDIADNTNGKYFEISESRNDTQRLISAINNVEGELRESKKIDVTQNRYFYFLSLAFALVLLDLLLSVRLIKI